MVHLLYKGPLCPGDLSNPAQYLKRKKIGYQYCTPKSSCKEGWIFWNCLNLPDKLPRNLEKLEVDLMDFLGNELTSDMIRRIIVRNKYENDRAK